ncbi:HAD family hydrolase [Clostridium paraputrificum]|uniref:HAD family hydrolase n=1 Tax=Clostridium paraputrificum TaxID=29363 RepID=UPI003D33F351
MRNIEAVIFDMDGLMFDTERISFRSWKEVCKKEGLTMEEDFYTSLIGRNLKGFGVIMKETYGEDFPLDRLYEEKIKIMTDFMNKNGVPVKTGLHELLDYLKDQNYKVAVATSTSRERALHMLEMAGVKNKVNYVICGDEVINSKPNPEIFLKAAEKLGVSPDKCIVLEDSGAGIEAAHAAGMKGINVPDMKVPDEEMKKRSFMICNSLLEVRDYLKNV